MRHGLVLSVDTSSPHYYVFKNKRFVESSYVKDVSSYYVNEQS